MAEVRPFRGLRYAPDIDPALTIAPPYDVISAAQQDALYGRSPHNIVRIEYGKPQAADTDADNRYTRAARDLRAWRDTGVLRLDDAPALYAYRQEFAWAGQRYARHAVFTALRLEEWAKGIVRPHEYTLANPKADRMSLLRATRTQVSPVYSIVRSAQGAPLPELRGETVLDCEADGQRHVLSAVTDAAAVAAYAAAVAGAGVYIADGHHRYETALAYRDEVRAAAARWTGEEAENFVLMALTAADDPGLVVLPTHRLVNPRQVPADADQRIAARFEVRDLDAIPLEHAMGALGAETAPSFLMAGPGAGSLRLLTLRDRASVEALMPDEQSAAWKRLDVNVLQYGILLDVFGIDDAALAAGGAVSYIQEAAEACDAVARGSAHAAFLLNATPVEQVLAVADADGRMPQKSTYFYPKLPTGLVLRPLE